MKPVKIEKVTKGMIFLLEDQLKAKLPDNRAFNAHNYIVLGGDGIRYHCMSITSLNGRKRTNEVPIICSNGKVSYIIPTQIYVHVERKFTEGNYHGMIHDGVDEFLQFLMELYTDSLGINQGNHDNIIQKYDTYCKNFFADMPGYVEESKPEEIMDAKEPEEEDTGIGSGGFLLKIPQEVYDAVKISDTKDKGDEFKSKIKRHPKYWETDEIRKFLSIMDQHPRDRKFKMNFIGTTNPHTVDQKVYLARKELKARGITV